MAAATSVHVVAIVEPIIQHADWFFPEGKLWVSFSVFHRHSGRDFTTDTCGLINMSNTVSLATFVWRTPTTGVIYLQFKWI